MGVLGCSPDPERIIVINDEDFVVEIINYEQCRLPRDTGWIESVRVEYHPNFVRYTYNIGTLQSIRDYPYSNEQPVCMNPN